MKYRIYSSYRLLHLVKTVYSMEEVIDVIDNIIYKEDAHYIVIGEENNMDIPVLSLFGIDEWEEYKSNLNQKVKKLR